MSEPEAKPGGRPTSWKPEYLEIIRQACRLGATDHEIAAMLGVMKVTIYNWRARNPELAEAMKAGKDEADDRIERTLYERACGYEDATGRHIPADTTAMIFWLKNRRREQWRDAHRAELTGPDGGPMEIVNAAAAQLDVKLASLAAKLAAPAIPGQPDGA